MCLGNNSNNNNPVKKMVAVSMDDVLLASGETNEERELRIRGQFNFFDVAKNGYLDYAQIEAGLYALQVPPDYKYAKDLFKVCDANSDGRIDYPEFRRYMDDKELELYQIFQSIDVDQDGSIQSEELSDALGRNGIEMCEGELNRFVEHVDKDQNGIITFEEWRDFLLLYPHEATIENIYEHWERVCLVDIGEHAVILEGISKHGNAIKYFIAGGIAGAISRTATAPLDRLKVVLQVQTTRASIMPAIMKIKQQDGLLGFFRGNGLNIVKIAPESAIKFYAYEMMKKVLGDAQGNKSDIGLTGRLFAGGIAGAIAQASIFPLEVIKTRLQTCAYNGGTGPKIVTLTKSMLVQEGPRAFYRGLVPSLLGIIPYAGIDLAAYETLKDISKRHILNDTEPGVLVQLGCGTVSGALGATCVYPLQVIRTRYSDRYRTIDYVIRASFRIVNDIITILLRLMAQPTNTSNAYKGMSDAFWRTFQHEGFKGFYKGLFPNLLKVVPSASITYMVYESMKKNLDLD